jgi:hypothetical protein
VAGMREAWCVGTCTFGGVMMPCPVLQSLKAHKTRQKPPPVEVEDLDVHLYKQMSRSSCLNHSDTFLNVCLEAIV